MKELRTRGEIDDRLYNWGEVLRQQRNIGAHANEEDVSREDASDVLAFALAFCEYVYVLAQKYAEFLDRQNGKQKLTPTPPNDDGADKPGD